MALGLFRMMASLARDMVVANTFGSASLLAIFLLGGFIVPKGRLCRSLLVIKFRVSFPIRTSVLVAIQ